MSTALLPAPSRPAVSKDPGVVGIPFGRLLRVELRKLFDTRSGYWLMASILISALLATVAVILFAADDELTYSTFAKAIGYPIAAILPIIALLSVTSEWSQRSGLTTFTLVPHRSRIIWAKAVDSVGVGVVSMLLAFAVGALGNVVGTAITGTPLVWDIPITGLIYLVLGNVLGLLSGFMLGVLIRSSAGAIVSYFVYTFMLTALFAFLAASQDSFRHLQPWVDVTYAQTPFFDLNGSVTGEQWANIGVTGVEWLILPLAVGLWLVMRSEVK